MSLSSLTPASGLSETRHFSWDNDPANTMAYDTVSNLILLGVPNSIEEDVIKDTLDKVLSELEHTLLQTDREYKLTKDQRQNWINYAVNKDFPPGMPWEDAEEKKKKQGATTRGLHMYCRSINPTTIELANYAIWKNNASCGPTIGETRPLQLKYRRTIANKAKKSTISRWYRPMGLSSLASGRRQSME